MSILQQLVWGSGGLVTCLILHVLCISAGAGLLARLNRRLMRQAPVLRTASVIVLAVGAMVIALTLQVWIWSFVYFYASVLPDWNTAIYFSMVTFTTLGYGDIVLEPGLRIFATFGAVTGLFSFGLSTAFLVAAATRFLIPDAPLHSNGENSRETGAP